MSDAVDTAVAGLIGRKVGMTQVFSPAGELVPVTVIELGPCTVVATRQKARDGYVAAQLGFGAVKAQRVVKPRRGQFSKAGTEPFRVLREFPVRGEEPPVVGTTFTVGPGIRRGRPRPGDRYQQGPGDRRRREAARIRRVSGVARHARVLPARRLDRQPVVSGARAQGQAHVRTSRSRARDHAQSEGRGGARPTSISCWYGAPYPAPATAWSSSPSVAEAGREHGGNAGAARAESCAGTGGYGRSAGAARGGARPPASAARDGEEPTGVLARRHARHQDPWLRERWWQEAVAPEGHGPRACGQHPVAAVARWRHHLRAAAAFLRVPAAPRCSTGRAVRGAGRPAWRRSTHGGRRLHPRRAQDEEGARGVGAPRARGQHARRPARGRRARATRRPQPARRQGHRAKGGSRCTTCSATGTSC